MKSMFVYGLAVILLATGCEMIGDSFRQAAVILTGPSEEEVALNEENDKLKDDAKVAISPEELKVIIEKMDANREAAIVAAKDRVLKNAEAALEDAIDDVKGNHWYELAGAVLGGLGLGGFRRWEKKKERKKTLSIVNGK